MALFIDECQQAKFLEQEKKKKNRHKMSYTDTDLVLSLEKLQRS